ncbi:MAG TPA: alanine--tRNA ligase, partial [Candidatus Methanomethylia archaeon]|nr:alanine--tRNA ligase [Candidatus Methanomethylicia archaeon]
PIFKVGEVVKGKVNLEQRKHLSRHHTATHILLGAARRVLGEHVWQEGAQKEVEKARLDISHYKRLTRDEIRRIEELANRVVMSNLPVHTFFEDRNAAEQRYGFRLYQGGVVPGKLLRIVEIPGWDVEACGGIHCKTTGEVGLIKILRTERIQDGVERLEFAAGEMALRDIWRLEGMVEEVAAKLEVPVSQTPKAIERLSSELRELRRKVEKLRSQLSKAEIAKLKSLAVPAGKFSLYHDLVEGADVDDLIAIASQLAEEDPRSVVLLFTVKGEKPLFVVIAGREVLNSGIDGAKLAKVIADSLEGRGGGKRDIGQGVGKSREFIPEAVNAVKKLLESQA